MRKNVRLALLGPCRSNLFCTGIFQRTSIVAIGLRDTLCEDKSRRVLYGMMFIDFLDGQVNLDRLQTDNFCLFLSPCPCHTRAHRI